MAYGDWGAWVYRDGEPRPDRQDVAPCPGLDAHHAVLGGGAVRLCAEKRHPVLYRDGVAVDLDAYVVARDGDNARWRGALAGHRFAARQYGGTMVDLHLTEPDGARWNATSGYLFGAGHMDG